MKRNRSSNARPNASDELFEDPEAKELDGFADIGMKREMNSSPNQRQLIWKGKWFHGGDECDCLALLQTKRSQRRAR
jgi:hypothetical protein